MRLRDAGVDDVLTEVLYVADKRGARLTRRAAVVLYQALKRIYLWKLRAWARTSTK